MNFTNFSENETIRYIGWKSGDLDEKIKRSKDKMTEIQEKLDVANRNARVTLKFFKGKFLDHFEKKLYDLYNKCVEYLKSDE